MMSDKRGLAPQSVSACEIDTRTAPPRARDVWRWLRGTSAVLRQSWWAYLLPGVIGIVVYLVAYDSVRVWLFPVLASTCPVAVAAGVWRGPAGSRAPWLLLGGGYGLMIIGDITWAVLEASSAAEVPVPSLADAFYLAGYPVAGFGLMLLVRHFPGRSRLEGWLDSGMLTLSVASVAWAFMIDPLLHKDTMNRTGLMVALAYPLADLVLLLLVARLVFTTGVRTTSFRLLLVSLGAMLTADAMYYAGLHLRGDLSGEAVIDAFWLGSYFLLGAAALHSSAARTTELPEWIEVRLSWYRLSAFIALVMVGPATALLHGKRHPTHHDGLDAVADTAAVVVTAAGPSLLLVVRLALSARLAQARARELDSQALALREALREQLSLQQMVSHQAMHDPLTGLSNRTMLQDRLERILARGAAADCGLLLLDLDGFKDVNDTLGHSAGDELLISAAGRLLGTISKGDTVARLGGDEFAILAEQITLEQLRTRAQRVLAQMHFPFETDGKQLYLTASIGALMLDSAHTPSEALRNADLALYAAKEAGKNRVEVFHPSMGTARLDYARVATGLRRALVRSEFVLHYQPVINLHTGTVVAAEALLRWSPPELGPVPPAEFIPVAEETGLIVPVGAWVLREACQQARRWREEYPHLPFTVTVNISGRQLKDPGFACTVTQTLDATGLEPSCLVLEITETVLITSTGTDLVTTQLAELRALGVHLAIDDFGTGYSSLAYLRHLPVDLVKMDRIFIQGDDRPGRNGAKDGAQDGAKGWTQDWTQDWTLPRAILRLSESLGLSTIAEGVETSEQAEQLHRLGCPYAQGYHFARPVPADRMSELLAAQSDGGRDTPLASGLTARWP